MTTIATDGKSMAGDGLTHFRGTIIATDDVKVLRLDDGRLLGSCGSREDSFLVADWLNGKTDRPVVAEDFGAILLNPDGTASWMANRLRFGPADVPTAMGSGMDMALAAMKCGRTAREAIEVAGILDINTGGTVTVLHLNEGDDRCVS